MSQLLTTKQIQDILKIDRVTIYRMLNDGRLKGVKVGNQWRFSPTEIDRLLGKETEKTAESAPKESPITDFPVDCVQKLQEVFAGILGIGSLTVSLEGEPLTKVNYSNPFCKLMVSNANGCQGCMASWRKVTMYKTGDAPYQTCHAGLSYLRTPIYMQSKPVAVLVAGQFYLAPPDPEKEARRLDALSIRCQIPLSRLKEAAAKIPVLKRSEQEQVQEWAPKVAMTVQSMLCERSELMNRLQQIANLSNVQQTLSTSPSS